MKVRYTAAWCKTCGKPVWLPHREHEGDLVVRYDAGRRPILRLRRPEPPAMTAIKRYRTLFRLDEVEKALAVIERADLSPRHLDEGRRLCLGVRTLCYLALRMPQAARADRDRLYAQDPQHPLMGEIEHALEQETEGSSAVAPEDATAGRKASETTGGLG